MFDREELCFGIISCFLLVLKKSRSDVTALLIGRQLIFPFKLRLFSIDFTKKLAVQIVCHLTVQNQYSLR